MDCRREFHVLCGNNSEGACCMVGTLKHVPAVSDMTFKRPHPPGTERRKNDHISARRSGQRRGSVHARLLPFVIDRSAAIHDTCTRLWGATEAISSARMSCVRDAPHRSVPQYCSIPYLRYFDCSLELNLRYATRFHQSHIIVVAIEAMSNPCA